ncbi:hypothetical protein M1M86_00910, partial [Dehalococcoidales bacterium]|nr:hypothetical protein [Dehalococcoidales bacterium]
KQFARFLEDNISFREPARWHFEMHQKIGGVEIKPEKDDHSWKVKVIVHPRKDDIDVINLISGEPMWMLEDLDRIKGFLQPYISDVVLLYRRYL